MKIKIKNARTGQIVDHDSTLPVPEGHGIVTNFLLMDSAEVFNAPLRVRGQHHVQQLPMELGNRCQCRCSATAAGNPN